MFIINFHHVEPTPRWKSRQHITITPQGLSRVIRTLRWMGFEIVCMRDVLAKGGPEAFGRNTALLTFDDGYENFYQHAAPVLESLQCPGTVFVLAHRFGGTNDWDQGDLPKDQRDRLMTVEQMKVLSHSPYITMGSHGLLHQHYDQLDLQTLNEEIHLSHAILSKTLGNAYVPVLAYPWGDYSAQVVAQMEQSPYKFAVTTQKGRWESSASPFEVPRYSVYHRDGQIPVFLSKLLRNGIVPLPGGNRAKPASASVLTDVRDDSLVSV